MKVELQFCMIKPSVLESARTVAHIYHSVEMPHGTGLDTLFSVFHCNKNKSLKISRCNIFKGT